LIEIVFLFAMFGLVILNDMTLMLLCWELTTLASFLLIGYTKTPEAVRNSMSALRTNVFGGLLFTVAIILFDRCGTTDFRSLAALKDTPLIQVAVFLMCVAALTKSAQFPFSRWLLGAMVAPTPSSALLHSSTMVKAGVYLILRLAPHLGKTEAGIAITLIGSITFFVASLMTVSQTDAKRMLAFSTISNLGLIIAVGAVGTAESIWAAVMLIIFHAVTKALLFLSVGTTEHQIGSRDIEDMDGLFLFSKSLGIVMLIGIAGMFVAPFGMLISKWAAMKAFLDSGNMFIVLFLAFGSAAILFAWTKWMGNIIAKVYRAPNTTQKIPGDERISLYILAGLVTGICLLHFLLSRHFVEPYVHESLGLAIEDPITLTISTVFICILCGLFVLPVLLIPLIRKMSSHPSSIYMGGANADVEKRTFYGSLGKVQDVELRNFYMKDIFGERFWIGKTIWLGSLILLVSTGIIVGGFLL
jgi:ech hydrogenase subunit A